MIFKQYLRLFKSEFNEFIIAQNKKIEKQMLTL